MQRVNVALDLFEVVNALLLLLRDAWARGKVDTLAATAVTVATATVVDIVPVHRAESTRRMIDEVTYDADELGDDLAVVVDERV